MMKDGNETYYFYPRKPEKSLFTTYMSILITQKETNARPYNYYYKKIK